MEDIFDKMVFAELTNFPCPKSILIIARF